MANIAMLYAKMWHNTYYLRYNYKEHIEAISYLKKRTCALFWLNMGLFLSR